MNCEKCPKRSLPDFKKEGTCYQRYEGGYLRYENFKVGKVEEVVYWESGYKCQILEKAIIKGLIEDGGLSCASKIKEPSYAEIATDFQALENLYEAPTYTKDEIITQYVLGDKEADESEERLRVAKYLKKIKTLLTRKEFAVFYSVCYQRKRGNAKKLADRWGCDKANITQIKGNALNKLRLAFKIHKNIEGGRHLEVNF